MFIKEDNEIKMMDFAGNHKHLKITSMILAAISAIFFMIPLICIWKIGDIVLNNWPDLDAMSAAQSYGWMAFGSVVVGIVIYTIALLCSHKLAFRLARNMKDRTMSYILSLPLGYFDEITSGTLRRIVYEGADRTESYIAHRIPDMACNFMMIVCFIGLLFVFYWKLGLISLLLILVAIGFISIMFAKNNMEGIQQFQSSLDEMSGEATEYIRGMPVVKTFQQSVFSFQRLYDSISKYNKFVVAYTNQSRIPMTMTMTAVQSFAMLLVPVGIVMLSAATDYTLFLDNILFYLIFAPLSAVFILKISYSGQDKMLAVDGVRRIVEIYNHKPLKESEEPVKPESFEIEFENVTFSYGGTDKDAISDFNLKIGEGETVALVGVSGSGKTTVARLIPRFWDVNSGSVKIGGKDVRDISSKDLLSYTSLVLQDTMLNKMTIRDNIRFAKPDATDEEIMAAVKSANCSDIISRFPRGLDTMIGTKGIYLSGGEVQRIAIARAILKDSPILILDEATAFADPENEHEISMALRELMKGRTILVIAHRLSSIVNADNIVVMKKGKIIQQGTHRDMISVDGPYSDMWKEYTSSISWKIGRVNADAI